MGKFGPFVFALAVLLAEPFARNGLGELSRFRGVLPCTCIGSSDAPIHIVYLHGSDTFAPAWIEIENRQKLEAIARILHAGIALPRARGSWPRAGESIAIIDHAAEQCFGRGRRYGVVGFSNGANLVNRLMLECRHDVAEWMVSAGSSEGVVSRSTPSLAPCGRMRLLAGRHEPGLSTTRGFARQLEARGADVKLVEHPGPHELPFGETLAALEDVTRSHEQ